jgi:hypothetical protein
MTDFLCISKHDLFSTLGESAPHILTDMRRRVIRKYKKLHRNKSRRLSLTAPANQLLDMIKKQRERVKEETGARSESKIDRMSSDRKRLGIIEAAISQRAFADHSMRSIRQLGFIPSVGSKVMLSQMSSVTSSTTGSSRQMLSHASSMSSVMSPIEFDGGVGSRLASVASDSSSSAFSGLESISDGLSVSKSIDSTASTIHKRQSIEDLTKDLLKGRSISNLSDVSSRGENHSESSSCASTPRGDRSSTPPAVVNVNVKSPFLRSADTRSNTPPLRGGEEVLGEMIGPRIRNIERTVSAQMDWLKLKQMKQEESIRNVTELVTELRDLMKRERADRAYKDIKGGE